MEHPTATSGKSESRGYYLRELALRPFTRVKLPISPKITYRTQLALSTVQIIGADPHKKPHHQAGSSPAPTRAPAEQSRNISPSPTTSSTFVAGSCASCACRPPLHLRGIGVALFEELIKQPGKSNPSLKKGNGDSSQRRPGALWYLLFVFFYFNPTS